MLMGVSSPDAYYHASLAQMILHYGTFSIGADGLARYHYHFLSHFVAAGLSRSSNLSVPLIYNMGGIGLKLDAVSAAFFASVFFFPPSIGAPQKRLFWTLLFAWLAVDLTSEFESESYMLGVALIVSALPFLLALTAEVPLRAGPAAITSIAAIFAVMLCAAAKISMGFYGGIASVIAAWHHRANKTVLSLLSPGLLLLATFVYFFVLNNDGALGVSWRTLGYSYLQYVTWRTLWSYGLLAFVIMLLMCSTTYRFSAIRAEVRLENVPIKHALCVIT